MVISCPECSTRFRVDESKIPERGAKIRCARCKHIFAVAPPTPEPDVIIKEPILPHEEPAAWEEPAPEKESETAEEPSSKDEDFGFDDFGSAEIGGGAKDEIDPSAFDDEPGSEDEDFSFGDDYGNVSLGDDDDGDNAEEEEPFSFGEPTPPAPPERRNTDQEQFRFSPAPQDEADLDDPLADSFNEDPSLNDISMPSSENKFIQDTTEELSTPPSKKTSSRGPLSVVILFVLILILAILVAVGFLMWKNGPDGVGQIFANLTGQGQQTELKRAIRLSNLQGSFISNRKEGELFVIQGIAINDLSEAQAAIQVKGIIFDTSGKQLMQKTIFCGNPISDNDLRKISYSKMEEMMGNQFGESLANLNVTSGQSIPFTIVFRKLPKTLSEFVVEVADTKPAAQ